MDYQFKRDIYGSPIAKLSMGHEIVGRWLTDELGSSLSKTERLINLIEEIEKGARVSAVQKGADFELHIGPSEVEFELVEQNFESDHDQMNDSFLEQNELNTDQEGCSCGLVDFKQVVLSWKDYIHA
jgi:uncharacterized protein YacL (UPF0231 family)